MYHRHGAGESHVDVGRVLTDDLDGVVTFPRCYFVVVVVVVIKMSVMRVVVAAVVVRNRRRVGLRGQGFAG